MDFSSTQRNQILAALPETGWSLADRHTPEDGWIDELWRLESVWSPRGRVAYLLFLVDPQWDGPRRFGEAVWAVAVTKTRPEHRMALDSDETVPIRPRWARDREALWTLLRRLHQA